MGTDFFFSDFMNSSRKLFFFIKLHGTVSVRDANCAGSLESHAQYSYQTFVTVNFCWSASTFESVFRNPMKNFDLEIFLISPTVNSTFVINSKAKQLLLMIRNIGEHPPSKTHRKTLRTKTVRYL